MENETTTPSTASVPSSKESVFGGVSSASSTVPTKKVGLLALGIIFILVCMVVVIKRGSLSRTVTVPAATSTPKSSAPRKDFGQKVPDTFVKNIPLPEGATFTQSYSLEYPEQKQYTIVFGSTKTVQENYKVYASFLKNEKWYISNSQEGAQVSSLYAIYMTDTINITINESVSSSTKSQVSISLLKK